MWRAALPLLFSCCTICAGAQFTLQDSGTTADLRGIVNVGNGTAWASGNHGTILRTEDSGFVWQGCTVPPGAEKLDFRGIQAFDDQTAIVMSSGKGDLSRVYKTTDGCETWKLVFTNPDAEGFFDGVSLTMPRAHRSGQPVDVSHVSGLLFGDPVSGEFPIFQTSNGGSTWGRPGTAKWIGKGGCTLQAFRANAGESSFAASNGSLLSVASSPVFITGGLTTRIWYSTDFALAGGFCRISAHAFDLPLAKGKLTTGAFAMAPARTAADAKVLQGVFVVVGGDYSKPNEEQGTAATVSNLPSRFRRIQIAKTPPHGYRSSVAYDAKTKTWITVGPNGTDVSSDHGRNWRALRPGYGYDPNADKQWNALSLPYVVGPHGRIGRLREDALSNGK